MLLLVLLLVLLLEEGRRGVLGLQDAQVSEPCADVASPRVSNPCTRVRGDAAAGRHLPLGLHARLRLLVRLLLAGAPLQKIRSLPLQKFL